MNARHLLLLAALCGPAALDAQDKPQGGATEDTPSKSEYFSWINNTNEGATDAHTRVNLDFFGWLRREYGMQLDIYAFDAGAIDGSKMYGSTQSGRFARQFPQGFAPLAGKAASMGTKLGIWCGPDGFGDTDEEGDAREEMMVGLARDYHFGLFKMDAVCGQLRPEKYDRFDRMMTRVRQYCPDFVMLNHRLDLGKGTRHSTTYLLGGDETYIDVHMANSMTATHHRAQALSRKSPEPFTRLTEDHGVCLSSCMDYWEDDLVLQAFGRDFILAPEIYANPWLLRDEEYPQLAYIFNLHRMYRDILPPSLRLDEGRYGPEALSRGSARTRFITLRNMTWRPVTYRVRLDKEVGLAKSGGKVRARLYHPYILDMGERAYGQELEVEVLPFRAALLKVTTEKERDNVAVSGTPYQILRDVKGAPRRVRLLGMPGQTAQVRTGKGKARSVTFPGKPLTLAYHRELPKPERAEVPADASALYYATCYAADNNALEARSLARSGETRIPEVKAARDAFFGQRLFRERDLWDRYLFDGDPATGFAVALRWGDQRVGARSALYIDLGRPTELDELRLKANSEYDISPLRTDEGMDVQVSADLKTWRHITALAGQTMSVDMSKAGKARYVKLPVCPMRLVEVEGYKDGKRVDNSAWRANNLFRDANEVRFRQAWKSEFTLPEAPRGSYLCVAVNGKHGFEAAWAALKVDGKPVGCPDRAPSFKSNTWECPVRSASQNYTYYVPLTPDMAGKKIEAWVLGENKAELNPEVWVTAYPIPFEHVDITLD